MTDIPTRGTHSITISQCHAPLSSTLLERVAEVMASAYATTGMRAWTSEEIAAFCALDTSILWLARRESADISGFLLASIVENEGEILALAVEPALQRQKIAQRLVNEIVRYARGEKIERLLLEVASTNCPAISFYQILNFHEIGVRPDYYRIESMRIDARLMEMRFN